MVQKDFKVRFRELFGNHFYTFFLDDWIFKEEASNEILTGHFKVASLKGFGVEDLKEGLIASGVIMHYLSETQHHQLEHISNIQRLYENDFVWMDKFTVRNLELYQRNNPEAVTLLDVIDSTISPMGGRMLKRWLALPLKNIEEIRTRQEVVRYFIQKEEDLEFLNHHLDQISDLERLISKLATGKINPREVVLLKDSLEAILPLRDRALSSNHKTLISLAEEIDPNLELIKQIDSTLEENAPILSAKETLLKKV